MDIFRLGGGDSGLGLSLFHCYGCLYRKQPWHSWRVARFRGILKSQDYWPDSLLLFSLVFSRAVSFLQWNIKLCITTLLVVAEPRVMPGGWNQCRCDRDVNPQPRPDRWRSFRCLTCICGFVSVAWLRHNALATTRAWNIDTRCKRKKTPTLQVWRAQRAERASPDGFTSDWCRHRRDDLLHYSAS